MCPSIRIGRTSIGGSSGVATWTTRLKDGNTFAYYKFDDLGSVTKSGANLVSRWNDFFGSGHDLIQAGTDEKKPVWSTSGITFDGVAQFLKTGIHSLPRPVFVYIVFKQITWTHADYIFDGYDSNTGTLYQLTSTPNLTGLSQGNNNQLALDTFGIVRVLLTGGATNGKIQVNNNKAVQSATIADADMRGFTLGARGTNANLSNIKVTDVIIRTVNDTQVSDNEVVIYNGLNKLRNLGVPDTRNTFTKSKFLITFDDSTDNQHSIALPILLAKGVKASFSVPTDWIDTAGYMTWANIVDLYNNGMNICCHGKTSVNFTTLNEAQLKAELASVNASFIANGLPAPEYTFYPGGAFNDNIKTWTAVYRLSARTTAGSTKIFRDIDKMIVPSGGIDNIDAAGMVALKAKIDDAVLWNSAVSIYTHGVTAGGGVYSMSVATFEEMIDYVLSKNMDIVTYDQFYNLLK